MLGLVLNWVGGGIISGKHPNNNSNSISMSQLLRRKPEKVQQTAMQDMHGRRGGAIGGRGGVTRGSIAGCGVW